MSAIKQAVSWWCFVEGGMTPQKLLRAAADIGYAAVELVEQEYWPLVKECGLAIASIAPSAITMHILLTYTHQCIKCRRRRPFHWLSRGRFVHSRHWASCRCHPPPGYCKGGHHGMRSGPLVCHLRRQ